MTQRLDEQIMPGGADVLQPVRSTDPVHEQAMALAPSSGCQTSLRGHFHAFVRSAGIVGASLQPAPNMRSIDHVQVTSRAKQKQVVV